MSTDYASLTGEYAFDPTHTTIGFVARHAMVTKVRGAFNEFEGTISIDGANPENSGASASVKVASVDTRNEQRNGHLLSGDFFEQDKYPEMTFRSTGVSPAGDDKFVLRGDLTVKDVTRPVEFEVEFTGAAVDPFGNSRIGFEARTTLSRKEFGMTWNAALETGGVLVSDKIQIELEISAIKQ
jgi:polyisoprenoid-binding protein YceI